MQTKLFEVRDRGTYIPVMATLMRPPTIVGITDAEGHGEHGKALELAAERTLLRRSGYPEDQWLVLVVNLNDNVAHYTAELWAALGHGTRTMAVAHAHIETNWPDLKTGEVVDVEYILSETSTPKQPEKDYAQFIRYCRGGRVLSDANGAGQDD